MITTDPHPLLDLHAFSASFPRPLGQTATPQALMDLLRLDAPAPLKSDDKVRESVRALLRHGGFKPTGRSKPASEYLLRAVGEGTLGSINLAVDVCNLVSLHSGVPISVVAEDKLDRKPGEDLRVGLAPPGSSYVFNSAGQVIDLGGLLCLFDSAGPCANAVKDAQRTKTSPETTRALVLLWGTKALPGRAQQAAEWYRQLLREAGATISIIHPPATSAGP